jgi:hypothetical protein
VIFLWPVKNYSERGHRLIGCEVAKNRSGPTGSFGLDFQGAFQRWSESTEDINAKTLVYDGRGRRKTFDDGGDE